MNGDSLEAIEPWIGGLLEKLAPRERKRLLNKLMLMVRRENAARIKSNREPDGASMVPRKNREAIRDRRKKPARMFRKLGMAKAMTLRVTPDQGEVRFNNRLVERTAAVHHYGLEDFVGRTRSGRVIRTRYTARRLLGFGKESEDFLAELVKHMTD